MFGLALWRALVSFRHYIVQGLARMRIGTKSIWIVVHFKQVGLWFVHTLSFGSSPPLSRLWSSTTPSPSTPPCAPTVSGENLLIPFMIFYVFLYLLMQIVWEKNYEIYKTSTASSLHWCGAWGDIWGKLALRAGGRRQNVQNMPGPLSIPGEKCELTVYHMQVESL